MIDFRKPTGASNPAEFFRQLRDPDREIPAAAGELLAERLRDSAQFAPCVAILCRWDDPSLVRMLDLCRASDRPELHELGERILVRRGLRGLERWAERMCDDEMHVRWFVEMLAEIPELASIRLLLGVLDRGSSTLRRRTADALAAHRGRIDGRALLRELAEPLVRGKDWPDPLAAIRALHRIADPALEPEYGKDIARRAERILINVVRHDPRTVVRGDAIAALGEIGSRAAVRCLVDMLHREEATHHTDVVIALRKIHPDRALMALLSLLQSQDPIIREEAANALGEIGDPKAVSRLRALLADESPDVRQEAVLAMGKLGGTHVLDALEVALADDDPRVRAMACHALAESMGSSAQGKLIRALFDDAADVRSEAAYQLGLVGDENSLQFLEAAVRDRARDAFGDRVGGVARRAMHRLARGLRRDEETG